MCRKSVCVHASARQSHRSETLANSSYFDMYISVKMATVVGAINRFIPSGYVQPACRISLGSEFTGLDLNLETFGLGLKDPWPCPWRCLQTHLALASKTSDLGLNDAVLEHFSVSYLLA